MPAFTFFIFLTYAESYLADYGVDFEGGLFKFFDEGKNETVEPAVGIFFHPLFFVQPHTTYPNSPL